MMTDQSIEVHSNKGRKLLSALPYILCASFYIWLATRIGITGANVAAPDEGMRALIPLAIVKGNLFPSGYDSEVIYGLGNWSYAFYPQVIAAYLSALFMAIPKVLGLSNPALVVSGRMASVAFSCATLYFFKKTLLFLLQRLNVKEKTLQIAGFSSVLLLGFWPQYAYLSSYMNNEIAALCGISIMFYACFKHSAVGWDYKGSALLALGIVITALAYLNSYGFILAAIVVFLVGAVRQAASAKQKVKTICFAVILCALGTFPFYILNFVRYGDFLGMTAFHQQYELWLSQGGEVLQNPYEGGLLEMLTTSNWIMLTLNSFVGYLGFMAISMPFGIALAYLIIFALLALAGLVYVCANKQLAYSKLTWLAGGGSRPYNTWPVSVLQLEH